MVIADDDVQAQVPRIFDLLHRRNPAVHGEEDPDAVRPGLVDPQTGDPVSFLDPVRDVVLDDGSGFLQEQVQHRRPVRPVHIVVAEDKDPLPRLQRFNDACDGFLHTPEKERVVE